MRYIVYESDSEVIVTTLKNESQTLKEFFEEDTGRDKDDYTRRAVEDCAIYMTSRVKLEN